MNEQEKGMIDGLFQRLKQAESQIGPPDVQADDLIKDYLARQPVAPYILSQVVLVQEQGLKNLQAQVEDLERQLAERPQAGAGFLGGLFGGGSQPTPKPAMASSQGWGNRLAQPSPFQQSGAQGGGFLAGALQTAMGVAGGVLLGNAIAGIFSSPAEAAASPAAAEPPAPAPVESEAPADEGGGFFDSFFGGGDEGGGDEW